MKERRAETVKVELMHSYSNAIAKFIIFPVPDGGLGPAVSLVPDVSQG
jgi:hypothetical protein